MGNEIDLSSGWADVLAAMQGSLGDFLTLLTAIGVVLICMAVAKFVWDKRKGGGQGSQTLIWTGVFACILAGPQLVFPIVLNIFDTLANFVLGFFPT